MNTTLYHKGEIVQITDDYGNKVNNYYTYEGCCFGTRRIIMVYDNMHQQTRYTSKEHLMKLKQQQFMIDDVMINIAKRHCCVFLLAVPRVINNLKKHPQVVRLISQSQIVAYVLKDWNYIKRDNGQYAEIQLILGRRII